MAKVEHSVYPEKPCRNFEHWYYKVVRRENRSGKQLIGKSIEEVDETTIVERKWQAMKIDSYVESLNATPSLNHRLSFIEHFLFYIGRNLGSLWK